MNIRIDLRPRTFATIFRQAQSYGWQKAQLRLALPWEWMDRMQGMPQFHAFELTFCGYAGSGKTALVEGLLRKLQTDTRRIAYIKSDVHSFSLDQESKDTARLWAAGAHQTFIRDKEHEALISRRSRLGPMTQAQFVDCDCVLIEGWQRSEGEKILVLDDKHSLLSDLDADEWSSVLAVVGPHASPSLPRPLPYFQHHETEALAAFILAHWQRTMAARPFYGLILTGGSSRRMGQDKALLTYEGEPQVSRMARMLRLVCDDVFESCRPGQRHGTPWVLPQIHDRFLDFGPLGALLSAQFAFPNAAWLVVACDLPLIDPDTLLHLKAERDPFKIASCYQNPDDGLPEPLCTIYEARSRAILLQNLAAGSTSLRAALRQHPIRLLQLAKANSLSNVNCPREYEAAQLELSQSP